MPDLGPPSSYLVLREGTPVYAGGGERIGTVEHVLAVPDEDIFDGLVLDTPAGPRFADSPLVDEIFERGVVLTIDRAAAERLPEPSANAAALEANADDTVPDRLHDKLRRAWDLVSGRY
jgi:hypothetical protein